MKFTVRLQNNILNLFNVVILLFLPVVMCVQGGCNLLPKCRCFPTEKQTDWLASASFQWRPMFRWELLIAERITRATWSIRCGDNACCPAVLCFCTFKKKAKGRHAGDTRGSGKYKAAAVHVKIKCPCERGRNLSVREWLCHQKQEHQFPCSQACYIFLFFCTPAFRQHLRRQAHHQNSAKACEKVL